jgi:hypothetical protein
MEEILKKNKTILQWLAGLGIPVALVFSTWLVSNSIETARLNSEYVRIALTVLSKEKPKEGNIDDETLRRWAVRLLNRKSPEKFTEEEQRALLKSVQLYGGQTTNPYFDENGDDWGGYGYKDQPRKSPRKVLEELIREAEGLKTPSPSAAPQKQQ